MTMDPKDTHHVDQAAEAMQHDDRETAGQHYAAASQEGRSAILQAALRRVGQRYGLERRRGGWRSWLTW